MTSRKALIALPLTAALFLASCADTGPRQKYGAATGAVAGGLLGGLFGKSPVTAGAGAVAGGFVGSMIGQQLDAQAGELRAAFGDDRIGVVNTGSELVVTMPQDILFATDSAALSGTLRSDLAVLAGHLKKYGSSTIRVEGHTDNTGTAAHNLKLSQQRAATVANALIANGVAATRITPVGKGESDPVASNLSHGGRAANRRVEIIIVPTA